ncbi:metallophosphoesterase [Methylobacterium pseudosasicola]|uniref:Calcineurin-like phosphoesterase n=1 Tax=Methylobacterium pseudosasicola TaxID=582667 RepID=A0A1I4PZ26_9HYPH|nr:metallophosphoesterase [Methylobacterium pseudosasicola]SFM32700.1 Calcineurin-like phosphoesterase [Methylobacterium pseudosasicola]
MRFWIFSDLHRGGTAPWTPPAVPEADVALVAGDVGEGVETSLAWLARTIRPHMRVAFVAGNHEYYRGCLGSELARGRAAAARLGIDFLEDEVTWIGDVAVAGCTLWTDYRLDGDDRVAASMAAAGRMLNDHRLIDRARRPRREPFLPEDAAALHRASRARLESLVHERAWTAARARVVVTHHAPAAASLDPAFAGKPLNPAFGSRLEGLVDRIGAELWVHGHVHASRDHRIGRARVVCNPKGYGAENPAFDPGLVIDLSA